MASRVLLPIHDCRLPDKRASNLSDLFTFAVSRFTIKTMIEIKDIQKVYFIGIGGIGMSALARYFKFHGA